MKKSKFKVGDRVRAVYHNLGVTFIVATRNPHHFPPLLQGSNIHKYSLVHDDGTDAGWDYEEFLVLAPLNGLQKLRKISNEI